jgi:predicted ATPase
MPLALEVSPFSLAERTAFVGRETEGSAIRAAIDRARTGHGSIVMLGGGAGVGKSRLAIEMAEYASQVGFRCSAGHCYERDEPFPYLPKPLELPAVQQRGYLFQSVSEALARVAGIRFQLLVLEDLHWAGESKLALLTHLARRPAPGSDYWDLPQQIFE